MAVTKLWKRVSNERLRVAQFLRFQKAADGTYFSALSPLYNVLPLVIPHLLERFADQRWLVYDLRRAYGYYYDGKEAEEVTFPDRAVAGWFARSLNHGQGRAALPGDVANLFPLDRHQGATQSPFASTEHAGPFLALYAREGLMI